MPRTKLDQYYTPDHAIDLCLTNLDFELTGTVLEPCCGENAISNKLKALDLTVITNDIDLANPADYHLDRSSYKSWQGIREDYDWIITNPPFNQAHDIIPLAQYKARLGVIALLRLTWLEPCANRREFLAQIPPDQILVTPRIRFKNNKTDNMTTAWFIWLKDEDLINQIKTPIKVVYSDSKGQRGIFILKVMR
jgi:hypothetical protein